MPNWTGKHKQDPHSSTSYIHSLIGHKKCEKCPQILFTSLRMTFFLSFHAHCSGHGVWRASQQKSDRRRAFHVSKSLSSALTGDGKRKHPSIHPIRDNSIFLCFRIKATRFQFVIEETIANITLHLISVLWFFSYFTFLSKYLHTIWGQFCCCLFFFLPKKLFFFGMNVNLALALVRYRCKNLEMWNRENAPKLINKLMSDWDYWKWKRLWNIRFIFGVCWCWESRKVNNMKKKVWKNINLDKVGVLFFFRLQGFRNAVLRFDFSGIIWIWVCVCRDAYRNHKP